jgi:hypothetical protein
MTGTAQDQKKAYRIVSTCKAFFPWYEPQIKDKFERQAWEELKAKVIPEVESYTDAEQLIADRQKFADKTLLQKILIRACSLRSLDPEYRRNLVQKKKQLEDERWNRLQDRRKRYSTYC